MQTWLLIVVLVVCSFGVAVKGDEKDSFTVLNWNAYELGANRKYPFQEVQRELFKYKADFVTIQEVKRCDAFYLVLLPGFYYQSANMWCAQRKSYPGIGRGTAGKYGVGIASSMTPQSDKIFTEVYGHTILGSRYSFKGQYFWVWNAHATVSGSPDDSKREKTLQILSVLVGLYSGNEPVIITGDFNANRDEPWGDKDPERGDMDVLLKHDFIDVYRELYPDIEKYPGYTYYNDRRVDYILVKNLPDNWKVVNMTVESNIWCNIGMNQNSEPVNCGDSGSFIDHSPMLLTISTFPAE